jgi:hypothetical protein
MGIGKYILTSLLSVLFAAVTLFLYQVYIGPRGNGGAQVTSQGPTIERLQKLAQLVTLNVSISDVIIAEGEGCKGSWLIRGDGLIGIDLDHAQIVDKNEEVKQASIRLPRPHVLQSRVDHNRTKTWRVEKQNWFGTDPDALRDTVMQKAQELVQQAADSDANISQAKIHAEEIIKNLYSEFGWTVTVTWQDSSPQPTTSK